MRIPQHSRVVLHSIQSRKTRKITKIRAWKTQKKSISRSGERLKEIEGIDYRKSCIGGLEVLETSGLEPFVGGRGIEEVVGVLALMVSWSSRSLHLSPNCIHFFIFFGFRCRSDVRWKSEESFWSFISRSDQKETKVCCCAATFSFSVVCRRSEEESEVKDVWKNTVPEDEIDGNRAAYEQYIQCSCKWKLASWLVGVSIWTGPLSFGQFEWFWIGLGLSKLSDLESG